MVELSQYSHDANLSDDFSVHLRAIRPDDKQRLLDGFHRLTGKSIYFRFLGEKHDLSPQELRYFTEIDFKQHVAIVAVIPDENDEKIIGVARYIIISKDNAPKKAEVAFAVDDEHQHLGIGTVLFEQLITLALDQGVTRMEAYVRNDNSNMLGILRQSGFKLEKTECSGITHIEFDISIQKLHRHF